MAFISTLSQVDPYRLQWPIADLAMLSRTQLAEAAKSRDFKGYTSFTAPGQTMRHLGRYNWRNHSAPKRALFRGTTWQTIISSSKNGTKATSRSASQIHNGLAPWRRLKKKRSPRRKISTPTPRSMSSVFVRRAAVRPICGESSNSIAFRPHRCGQHDAHTAWMRRNWHTPLGSSVIRRPRCGRIRAQRHRRADARGHESREGSRHPRRPSSALAGGLEMATAMLASGKSKREVARLMRASVETVTRAIAYR